VVKQMLEDSSRLKPGGVRSTVSVLFADLSGFTPFSESRAPEEVMEVLNEAFSGLTEVVFKHHGTLDKFIGDCVMAFYGAPMASGNDAINAVRSALEMRRIFGELKAKWGDAGPQLGLAIGINSGEAIVGNVGSNRRMEYTVIGDTVNVAARLMEAARGDILCDVATFNASSGRVAFEARPAVRVKGREGLVEIFQPIGASIESGEIVGRVAERQMLRDRLDVLARSNVGGVVILEGEPGIGKSRLVADAIEQAVAKGVRTMIAAGDSIERSTPYHLCGALIDNLLSIREHGARDEAEHTVRRLLESNPRLLQFASLLNPVLRLSLPGTEASESVTPRGRADLTRELLVHLFQSTAGSAPTVLVLEDAQWLDSASWAFAEALSRKMPELLMVIATRVLSREEQPEELTRLTAKTSTQVVHLEALGPDEGRALVCRRMRARVLSEPVARLIRDRTEGHPFFIEELVYALADRGLVNVEDGVCRLTTMATTIDSVHLPDTVQVVVASRIDRLSVECQLTIKVASVFGRTFGLDGLRAAYPIPIALEELTRHVNTLVEHRLVQLASPQPLAYEFKHAITQEVAYGLLPYQERRRLHAAAAAWYEEQHRGEDWAPIYPLLAHHWSRAEEVPRAISHLERAGDQALRRHANEEALRFFSEAVDIDERLGPVASSDEPITLGPRHIVAARDASRAGWACRLGEASTNLSRWNQGSRHFRNALALAGFPLPASDRDFVRSIAAGISVQCARRLGLKLFRPATGGAAVLLQDAVKAFQRLGTISYQEGQVTAVVHALISALNLAEQLGPGQEFALVCADVGNVLGLVPLPRLSRVYQRMAFRIADQVDDRVIAARIRARAALFRLGIGEWEACRDLETAMALCDEIGDSYLWEENAAIRARAAQLRGDFRLAARLGAEVRARATANRSVPHEIWGIAAESWASLHLGRHQYVLQQAQAGLRLLSSGTTGDQVATLDFLGATALAHLGRGDLAEAHHTGEQLMEAMRRVPRPGYFAALGISAAVETGLAIWEAHGASARGIQASRHVQQALSRLDRYVRVSPPARARALLWRGCAEWLQGRSAKATRSWRLCLDESERFALPYELARAHYELGRRLDKIGARRAHLVRAETEFRRMRADAELKRVAAALADRDAPAHGT
jgi:class 3 adenylate cyclase/tetratricopeptide (TPR) repeat protein